MNETHVGGYEIGKRGKSLNVTLPTIPGSEQMYKTQAAGMAEQQLNNEGKEVSEQEVVDKIQPTIQKGLNQRNIRVSRNSVGAHVSEVMGGRNKTI